QATATLLPYATLFRSSRLKGHLVLFKAVKGVRRRAGVRPVVLGPVEKADVVRHRLGDPAGRTVLRLVGAVLQAAFHGHEAPLAQVVRTRLRELPPGDDGKEVGFPFA